MKTFMKQLTRIDIDLVGGKGDVSEAVTKKESSFDEWYYGKDHQIQKPKYTEGNLATGEASKQAIWLSPRTLRASNQTTASSSCLPERRRQFSALGWNSSLMLVGSIWQTTNNPNYQRRIAESGGQSENLVWRKLQTSIASNWEYLQNKARRVDENQEIREILR